MKTFKLVSLAALSLMAAASCNPKSLDPALRPATITIDASIGELTKVQNTGYSSAFESGDQVMLYAWTGSATSVPDAKVVNGVKNTYDGSKWSAETQMLWADMLSPHYFLGIYPARTVTNFTADSYTLDPDDYTGSDLLIATNLAGLKAQDNPVALGFYHAMALLNVNLTFRDQWGGEPTVSSVTVTSRKTATLNYLNKAVTSTGTAEAVALKPKSNSAWSGLQVPQTGVNPITISIGGKNYVFTHTADIPLVSGQYTTVNLIVGRNQIDLESVSITSWAEGTIINNGEAQTD